MQNSLYPQRKNAALGDPAYTIYMQRSSLVRWFAKHTLTHLPKIVVGLIVLAPFAMPAHAFAASRFWVGGTGTWDTTTTTHWSATSGGAGGASVPTATDDVTFDANSNATAYSVSLVSGVLCQNLTVGAPASGKITFGSSNINIPVYGNLNMAGGTAGITLATSGFFLMSTTTGTQTVTTNGVVLNGLIISGIGGTTQLLDDFYSGGIRAFRRSLGAIFDPNGHKVTMTASNTGFSAGDQPLTFYDLSFVITTPSAADVIGVGVPVTVTHNLVITGASTTNRLLVSSGTVGTPGTITAASVTATNADFQDITAAGAANWDLSGIAGGSGDAGGNTGITFTAPVDQHWVSASGGNWSDVTKWTSRVPLPQDNVFFNNAFGTSQIITADMPRMGKNIDFTGATWTTSLTLSSSINNTSFGSLTMIAGLANSLNALTWFLQGRGTHVLDNKGFFNSSGRQVNIQAVTGSYSLASDFGLNTRFTIGSGTFNTFSSFVTNYNLNNVNNFVISGGTVNLGSGTHIINGSSANTWTNSANATINASSSIIEFTDTTSSIVSMDPGAQTYNIVWFNRGASSGSNIVTDNYSATFGEYRDTGTAAHTDTFRIGSTYTFGKFTVVGGASKLITVTSDTTATTNFVKTGGGTVQSDYLNLSHIVATPANTWYAGSHSVNSQAVTTAGSGWIFKTLITAATSAKRQLVGGKWFIKGGTTLLR
jgi:hypothetical protein